MANLVGTNLGKYRLVARLGRGGMAEVYKAYQPGLDRYVGIKVLHAHLVDDQDFINRFEREALAIGKLRHPNIVQAVDFDRDGEVYFMAMEFIDGPTLKDEVKARKATNKPFTDEEVSRIFTSLCSSIDYAHSRGMVHRDIKPANVMINDEGQVVLTDFGIARIMGATQYTQTGALSGTPAYMSPEQGQGERGDERSDIYSLGVMLYEMLTGIVPYDADTPFAVIMKHISEPLPMPSKINPDIREPVERVILKAMSKDPDDRYQTAGELARALRDSIGLSPDDTLRSTPLITVASAPQVEQIEHETGPISTMKPIQPAHGTMRGGGETVMAGAGVGTTQVAAAPDKKSCQ
jgi:serine/threonine protein kinase